MAKAAAQERAPGVRLDQIVKTEVGVINRRRKALGREPLTVSATDPTAVLDVTALAFSGGGIRSASFSLGVLQALNEHDALRRIDYLSTVSGGGYIGSALTATMTKSKGEFVFGESTGLRSGAQPADVKDTAQVGHLRNYSNYLIPLGARDLITAVAIVFRGLIANVSLVLPVVLLLAVVTIFSNPDRSNLLEANFFGIGLHWIKVPHFGITLVLSLLAFPVFFAWGLYRSTQANDKQSEFLTWLPALGAGYLLVVAFSFFCELQPFLVSGMFDLADQARALDKSSYSFETAIVKNLAAIAAPVAAVVTFFRQQVGTLLKSVTASSGVTTKLLAIGAQAAIWIAGAALPLLLWVGYLYLCYWGIINNLEPEAAHSPSQAAIHATVQIKGPGIDLRGTVDCSPNSQNPCGPQPARDQPPAKVEQAATKTTKVLCGPEQDVDLDDGAHTPRWLISSAALVSGAIQCIVPLNRLPKPYNRLAERPVTLLYLSFGLLLFVLSFFLTPNANSLHRLYRDRLSKAFLFDPNPKNRVAARTSRSAETTDQMRDFAPLDEMRISDLTPKDPEPPYAPYHLINAALNIQGSDFANRRGRNADFFLFSPSYVGSEATGYAETRPMEDATGLNLATAMAISGAAFSSNMGANSIRALTPTLALLNVRTGYWLDNPRFLVPQPDGSTAKPRSSKWYLWTEISGRLYEDSEEVYITDGGHIENLGVYELLRRRCKVIIVVDAEADPAMRLPSFIALQRYARIDLGVRINMPWDEIHKSTRTWMGFTGACTPGLPAAAAAHASITAPAVPPAQATAAPPAADKPPTPSFGPHVAIGTIDYDGGKTGWLVYIKSSLSGDENDYVRDYARRYDQFPHESTGDQFFSEEQFEVYRALGFHIASRLLTGQDKLQVSGMADLADINNADPNVKSVRAALLGG